MQRYPADHPVWRILQHSVYIGALLVFLWMNATTFDKTELVTIAEVVGALAGFDVIKSKLSG